MTGVGLIPVLIVVAVVCGFLSAMIAGARTGGDTSSVVAAGIIGLLFPVIGLIIACFIRPPTQPAGWRPDPWGQAAWRWHDGTTWTGVVSQDQQ